MFGQNNNHKVNQHLCFILCGQDRLLKSVHILNPASVIHDLTCMEDVRKMFFRKEGTYVKVHIVTKISTIQDQEHTQKKK